MSAVPQLAKPAYGTPCNGCGLCCQNEICPLGEIVFPTAQAPCPALVIDGERYVCGLVASPQIYAPIRTSIYGIDEMRAAAVTGVGAGIGCDARTPEDLAPPPADFVRELQRIANQPRSVSRKIEKLWSDPR